MEIIMIAVGALLVIVGAVRHFVPEGVLPKISFHLVKVPGLLIVGIGILLIIAGVLM